MERNGVNVCATIPVTCIPLEQVERFLISVLSRVDACGSRLYHTMPRHMHDHAILLWRIIHSHLFKPYHWTIPSAFMCYFHNLISLQFMMVFCRICLARMGELLYCYTAGAT